MPHAPVIEVLLVDDDATTRDFVASLFSAPAPLGVAGPVAEALSRFEFRVQKAANPAEAFKILLAEREDQALALLVVDLEMPMVGLQERVLRTTKPLAGIESLKLIRYYKLCQPTCKILVFSVHNDLDSCADAIRAGADAYVWKGDTLDSGVRRLAEKIAQVLDSPEEPGNAPLDAWFDDNYEWLSEHYSGKWVTVVPEDEALGGKIPVRAGYAVVSGDDYESLRAYVLGNPRIALGFPPIVYLPEG